MKQWNLGNTTARNPARIRPALSVFARDFVGRPWDETAQLEFYARMKDEGLIESVATGESSAIHARKFAAVFNQLGLAIALESSPPARLLPSGAVLLTTEEPGDVYLRQLLKYQLPSPRETRAGADDFDVHPMWVILYVSLELKRAGEPGLSAEECALFVNTCRRDDEAAAVCERLRGYRARLRTASGNSERKEFAYRAALQVASVLYQGELEERRRILNELFNRKRITSAQARALATAVVRGGKGANTRRAREGLQIILESRNEGRTASEVWNRIKGPVLLDMRLSTLADYGDTTLRYSMITELFALSGKRFGLKSAHIGLVERIVERAPAVVPDEHYEAYLGDDSLPKLPLDEAEYIAREVATLRVQAEKLVDDMARVNSPRLARISDQLVVAATTSRSGLRAEVKRLREIEFYAQHGEPAAIGEVEGWISDVLNRELPGAYLPAYLEWSLWRAFLVFNELSGPIAATRNFEIDEDIKPISHARSNHPDLVFTYADTIIVCEATLLTGERQALAEGEPVARHVANVTFAHPSHDTIGVFVAPTIHPQTAQDFYRKERWDPETGAYRGIAVVPLTVAQFISILRRFAERPFEVSKLLDHMKVLAQAVHDSANPLEWLERIDSLHSAWLESL
jgi:AlwI restriction endonuclease